MVKTRRTCNLKTLRGSFIKTRGREGIETPTNDAAQQAPAPPPPPPHTHPPTHHPHHTHTHTHPHTPHGAKANPPRKGGKAKGGRAGPAWAGSPKEESRHPEPKRSDDRCASSHDWVAPQKGVRRDRRFRFKVPSLRKQWHNVVFQKRGIVKGTNQVPNSRNNARESARDK